MNNQVKQTVHFDVSNHTLVGAIVAVFICLLCTTPLYAQPDRLARPQLRAPAQQLEAIQLPDTVTKRISPVLQGRSADFANYEVNVLPVEYKFEEAESNREVMLQPVIHPFKKLRYEGEGGGFTGGIMVFLENTSNPGEVHDLENPVAVWFSGEARTIDPEIVRIEQTNTPISIEIRDDSPADSILIEVSTAIDGEGYPIYIGVLPELISLGAEKEIQGGGFEVSELEVQLRGITVNSPQTVQFSLEDGKGFIEPKEVVLERGQHTARTTIRSEGWEDATVLAYVAGVGNARFNLSYGIPYSFLIFTVLGGLLGGLIRGMNQGKKVWKIMLSGLPPALLMVMLYFVLRVNLISEYIPLVDAYNEATVLIVGAISAIVGAKAIYTIFAGKGSDKVPA